MLCLLSIPSVLRHLLCFCATCFCASEAAEVARPKIYSVGDLHGDFDRFKVILEGLGLASFQGNRASWTGGASVLVSTGNTVDRGEHSRPIFHAFESLARQAADWGGEVVNLLGNHEAMVLQDKNHVTKYTPKAELGAKGDYLGEGARRKEFSFNGRIGRDIRNRYLLAAVRGSSLFVHAGLHPKLLAGKTVDDLNARLRSLLANDIVPRDPLLSRSPEHKAPIWDRGFARGRDSDVCELVEETLRLVNASRMVVGHSVQKSGKITPRCVSASTGARIILGDTAISYAYQSTFPNGRPSAAEYDGNTITAIYFAQKKGVAPMRTVLYQPAELQTSQEL